MRTMTCRELGGACEKTFTAATFTEMAALSRDHGRQMMQANDPAHLEAMQAMRAQCATPEEMGRWMKEKEQLFLSKPLHH